MNLERMKQVAVEHSKEYDKWAIICTDGDFEFAQTDDEALSLLDEAVDGTEYLSGDGKQDYGLVRVDV